MQNFNQLFARSGSDYRNKGTIPPIFPLNQPLKSMKNLNQKFSISTLMLFLTTLFLGKGQGDTTKTVEFRRCFNSILLPNTKSLSRLSLAVLVNVLFCGFMMGQTNTFDYGGLTDDWNTAANWSMDEVPTSLHDVIIPDGFTVVINTNAVCASLTLNGGVATTNVNFENATRSLTISGLLNIIGATSGGSSSDRAITLNGGILSCSSLQMSDTGGFGRTCDVKVTNGGTLNVTSNIAMTLASLNVIDLTNSGTLNIGGSITGGDIIPGNSSTVNYNGTVAQIVAINADYIYHNLNINNVAGATLQNNITSTNVTGALNVQSGTFNNGGFAINLNSQAFDVANGSTFNLSGTSAMVTGASSKMFGATSTVNYTGSNQFVSTETYGNLGLSGTDTKTFTGNTTITGNLSIGGSTKALLPDDSTSSALSLTLGGSGAPSGSHGSTGATATHENDNYFIAVNTGIVNVNNNTCAASSAVLQGDNTICIGGSSELQVDITGGVSPYTVVYSAGTVSNYTDLANISVLPVATTMYTLTSVTDALGCTASVSGMATVTVLPNAAVTSVSGTSSLCIGATATYTVSGVVLGGGTGAWSSSDPLVASVNSTTGEVTALTAGTTNIIFTITGGCNGTPSAQQSLTVLPNAAVTSVTGTSPLCIGAMATYTASGVVLSGGTGAWSSSNPSVASVDPGTGVVTALSIGTTNIIFTITGGCNGTPSAQQSFTVSPVGPTALTYTTSTNIYTEGTVITPNTVATITGTPPFVYTVTSLPPGLSINSATGTISGTPTAPTNSHTYTVTASNSCGSTSTTLTITINAIPFAGGACTLLNNNFSTNPQLANTNVNGAWYPDRYRPAGFTSNGSQLKISINANDGAQLRPTGLTGGFYNTQGRKINQCGGCVTIAKADLYIPADWATNKRRSDLWVTSFNSSNAVLPFYPIIGFRNTTGLNPQMSVWTGSAWNELGAPSLGYNTSYTLEFRINGSNLEYLINSVVVATYPSGGMVYFGDVMLQAYNFNDNTLGVSYDAGPNNSYDALWDNLVTSSGTGNVVTNTANGNTYCSIQSAIDDAQTLNGHTLAVQPGTYNEQVIVNKELTIKSATATKAIINFTGTVTGKPTLIDVTTNNVTIENLQFNVDLSKLKSAIIASSAGLDNIIIKDNMIGAYATPSSGAYGDRNAVSINYGGNTNYRVATGGVNSVSFTGNTVTGTAPDSYFRSAISVDEAGLTATGNTLASINHDVLLRFASNGANLISGNTFNGGGLELSDQNAGSGTITVSSNNFNGVGAPNTAVLRVKNNSFGVTHSIFSNTFTGFDWAVSLENMNLVTLNGNTFNGDAVTDRHIVVNTKSISSNSNTIVQVPIAATMTNNAFNGMGIGLTFQNHDSDNDSYGAFTIGSAGNANTFAAGLSTFIQLDAQTGISNGSTFPTYPNTGGWPTTMDCWATNLNIQNNTFDVGAGQQAPQAMSAAERTTLEGKLTHNPDVACLGTLQYFLPVKNVTQTTFYSTIQSAINASAAMDVIELAEWTFNERVVIDKSLTLQGVDSANVVITGAGLLGNGKGIQINNGVTNVTIKKLTVQNFSGSSGNADAGIYAIGGNNNLVIDQVAIVNNVGGSGFYANGPVNGVSITNVTSTGHTVGARGIVIWNGLKENINISNCHVYGNNCCGIELQDGTASGVTMNNNNVHDNGDNGLGLTGMQGPIANVISNNTITNNGRFGIEIKNPDGNGASSGAGSIVLSSNTVSLTSPIVDARDIAGIAIMRRGVLAGNTDVPTGVYVTGNTVTGYTQPSNSDGFGIVVAGTNHTVTGNTVSGNDVGIQQQAGHLPYPGDGLQDNLIDEYFGRDNTPFTCGNSITANSPNTTRNVGIIGGDGFVVNTNTGRTFCSIQSAINHTTTLSTHVLEVSDGTFSENITVSKSLTIKGVNAGVNANSSSDITMINGTRIPESILSATNIQVTAQNVTIDGFMFSGAGGIHTNGVSANAANGLTIVNNVFDNVPTSAYNNNSGAAAQSNLVFSNNRVVGNNTPTISAMNPWYISAVTMNANYFAGFERGVQLDNNSILTISNSYFTNITHQGLQVANACSNVNITANVFDNCNIMAQPDRGAIRLYPNVTGDINITNNIFTNNYNAVRVLSAAPFTHNFFKVNDNSFSANTKAISDGTTGSTGFIDGTCNWFGTVTANTIQSLLEGNVNYVSYLTSGNDLDNNIGFQPDGMCNGTPVTIVIATNTPATCAGGPNNGALLTSTSGGSGSYTFLWSNGATTADISSVGSGSYTVTVMDSNLSTSTASATVIFLPVTNTTDNPDTYYATIQAAINAADPNEVIDVCAGIYTGTITIDRSLTLNGANSGVDPRPSAGSSRVIGGPGESRLTNARNQKVININADNVTINGFEITQSGGSGAATTIETNVSHSGVSIINNIVTNTTTSNAMRLYGGQDFLIQKNYLKDIPGEGIVLRNGNNVVSPVPVPTNQRIKDNDIINQYGVAGGAIYTYGQTDLEISGNIINAKYQGIAIGAGGPAYYFMQDIDVHDNKISMEMATTAVQDYGITINGLGDNINIHNNVITDISSNTGTKYALIKVGYDADATSVTNPNDLVINNNYLSRNVNENYITVGTNITNPIDANCNWWNSANAQTIAARISDPNGKVDYTPWLVGGSDDVTGHSNGYQPQDDCTGSPLLITSATTDPITCGETTGSINVVWSGGTADYTVDWGLSSQIEMGMSSNITGLAVGTYTITVTDANGSTATTSATILYLPVTNSTDAPNTYYSTIQEAIDAADPNEVIDVCAGTYAENVVVDKSLTINGPNAAINPCSGTRVAEAVLTTAVSDIAGTSAYSIVDIQASDVSINGFTIDGDNTSITTGKTSTTGADIDIALGITRYVTGSNTVISNNIIKNVSYFGVELYDYPAGVPSSGNIVSNNKIQDLGTYDNTSGIAFWGGGVLLYNNQYAVVTNNCMENVRIGVQTGNFYQANPGAAATISTNMIQARRMGVFHNLHYGAATSPITVNSNTITALNNSNETRWYGIEMASLSNPGPGSTASGNMIDGSGTSVANVDGFNVWNCQAPTTISGGTITGVKQGVNVNNFEGYASNADNTSAIIDGVTISGATVAGVLINDNALNTNNARASAEVKNCTITNTPTGIFVSGADAGGNIHDNTVSGGLVGIQANGANTTAPNALNIQNNTVNNTIQVVGANRTTGIALANISGTSAATIMGNNIGNNISGPFYGYGVYNLNTTPVTSINGGTIKSVMQGIAGSNFLPPSSLAPSVFNVDGVTMNAFKGDHPSLSDFNFHAGIYTFTGGSVPTNTITSTISNVNISETGKIAADCAGLAFADFSTAGSTMQNITVNTSTINNNLNRGVNVRGSRAMVSINTSTLQGNGSDAYATGGNPGFTFIAHEGANLTASNNFIEHPATSATSVTAFLTGNGTGNTIVAHDNSVLMNGNVANGRRASNNAGSTINATCNWWGTGACPTDLISGVVSVYPYLTNGIDNSGAGGFQPVPGSCTEPSIQSTVTSPVGPYNQLMTSGNSYSLTICSGQLVTTSPVSVISPQAANCNSLRVRTVYNTTISTLPPTQTFDQAYSVASLLPPTSITPENHDGVAKDIVFVSTPYYDVNGNNQYDAGIDVAGGLITFTLTVQPLPKISNTVTSGVYNQIMVSGGSYTRSQCHNTNITTSIPTLTSGLANACGILRIRTQYISTLPNIPSATLDNTFINVVAAGPQTISPNNETGSTKTITFITKPYYDVDNSGSLSVGDIVGDSILFVLTVHPIPTATISGTATVQQNDPIVPVITFTGAVGTGPYTFAYNVNGGATQYVTSVNNVVTVAQDNSVLGTFTYTLLSVTDANGCAATIISNPAIAVIQVVPFGQYVDLAPAVARPQNGTFNPNQVKQGYVQFTNGGNVNTAGPITFRIFKPSNFELLIDNSSMVTLPGEGTVNVNNADPGWTITWSPALGGHYLVTSSNVIPDGSNVKIGFTLTAGSSTFATGNMTVDIFPASGGDNNPANNTAVRQFVIN